MEHPIQFPTYEEHIQQLFTSRDIGCMAYALDLSTYEGVVEKANQILGRVKAGTMPPPSQGRRWSSQKVKTFENWIDNNYQRVRAYLVEPSSTAILRKDVLSLSEAEINLLKKAFQGLRDRDSDINDRFSFFNLAGVHWYPGPRRYIHCRHHDNEYNPWHRAYLIVFENALRSVEGCEDVTLPYWDILGEELPSWVFEEPFYPYPYPHNLMDYTGTTVFKTKDEPIHRYDAADIRRRVFSRTSPIPTSINTAISAPTWEKFNGWSGNSSLHNAIIEAHDNGHGTCGLTVSNPATAAFDPLFWFFHCNWDRLWWKWQMEKDATTIESFKAKLEEPDGWLDDKPENMLKPFNIQSFDMINSKDWNVDYEKPKAEELFELDSLVFAEGMTSADKSFTIPSPEKVSVRIKNINRLRIAGSFKIDLCVNSKVIRSTRVFQPTDVQECENCSKRGIFSKDFIVDKNELSDGAEIKISIKRFLEDGTTKDVALSAVGNPSVNIRWLLKSN